MPGRYRSVGRKKSTAAVRKMSGHSFIGRMVVLAPVDNEMPAMITRTDAHTR